MAKLSAIVCEVVIPSTACKTSLLGGGVGGSRGALCRRFSLNYCYKVVM